VWTLDDHVDTISIITVFLHSFPHRQLAIERTMSTPDIIAERSKNRHAPH